jgi:hypothetical protein
MIGYLGSHVEVLNGEADNTKFHLLDIQMLRLQVRKHCEHKILMFHPDVFVY